jgi:hypothetical protein
MDNTPTNFTPRWTPQLVLEDALALWSDEDLCTRYDMTVGELTAVRHLAPYRKAVEQARQEIAAQGLTFKHKARLQAETFLDSHVPAWIGDTDTPLKDRVALLSKLVEWGELEPKKEVAAATGAGFVFVLNLNGQQQTLETTRVIDHAP